MQIFLGFMTAIDTPFDYTLHTGEEGFTVTFTQNEGEVAEITLEREQMGWAIMHPDQPRYAVFSQSMTGNPEDAVPIWRGCIEASVGDLFAPTQTIRISCAPENIFEVATPEGGEDGPVMTFARATLSGGPETSFVFDDADPDKTETYLMGRSAVYYIDPLTHEVSISDITKGDRVVNLSHAHFHDGSDVPETEPMDEPPVSSARVTFKGSWTQEARGLCDIAKNQLIDTGDGGGYAVVFNTTIQTMNPDFITYSAGEFPGELSSSFQGEGWELEANNSRVTMRNIDDTWWHYSGAYGRAVYLNWRNIIFDSEGNVIAPRYEWIETVRHDVDIRMAQWEYTFEHIWMRYDYSQSREEEITLVLNAPIQSVPTTVKELNLGEITASELTHDRLAEPWEYGVDYFVGDRRSYGGKVFECLNDHNSAVGFYEAPSTQISDVVTSRSGHVRNRVMLSTSTSHPNWKEVESTAPLRPLSYQLTETAGGKDIIAHLMCRLRKELLLRNRSLRITCRYLWEDAHDVKLTDSVRIQVPWHDGTSRAIVGKVITLQKEWLGEEGATIAVTIAVSMGDGSNGSTDATINGRYNADGYFPEDYIAGETDVYGVAGDVEYLIAADRAPRPIRPELLSEAAYAVDGPITIENQAVEQANIARQYASVGKDPRTAMQDYPTRLRVKMRDLTTDDILSRRVIVAGELLASPRGIDLINGEEP